MVGIALPIIFIILISIIVFVPPLFIKPQNNFLYIIENNYYTYNQGYLNEYKVVNGQLALDPLPIPKNRPDLKLTEAPTLYLYNVKTNTSQQISFEEAKRYVLDPGPSSSDGYIVKYEYNNSGIFSIFGGSNGDINGYFIEKGSGKKKLDGMLVNNTYSYQANFKFIGWIK